MHTDPDRCYVAVADQRVVGYSAGIIRGDWWYLAALFIDPAFQRRGVGRQLMELAMEDAPPWRMTISDAIQPVSNALYAKHGLLPATPILGFSGNAEVGEAAVDDELEPGPLDLADLARIDSVAYGFDRAPDHRFWATNASATLWQRRGEPVAYSYRWPTGRIGPLAGRDPESAAAALRAELTRRSDASINIPGTSRTLVATALASGLRLGAPPGLLLVTDGHGTPTSLAIASYGLM